LILLGTGGGPVPRAVRSQPAALLEVGGRRYLIDTGDGVVRQLAAVGYVPKDIQDIFLTHLHMDHVAGLATLLGFRWTSRAGTQLNVYGPVGTTVVTDGAARYLEVPVGLFAAQLPPGPPLRDTVIVHEIDQKGPAVVYRDDAVTVTAVENSHYQTMDPSTLPRGSRSFAYRFDTPQRSIVFTGDTGPSPAVEELASQADMLVSEVIDLEQAKAFLRLQYRVQDEQLHEPFDHMAREHLAPEEIGKMAQRAGVKMVVLTHVVMGRDDETDMRAYTDGVRRHFKGPVVMGRDLDEF
jgi:ribonuclease BN (tRNA processing enzyme)